MTSLTEMRRALETQHEEDEELDPEEAELREASRPKSRLPPSERGVTQSRSCLVEIEVPDGANPTRRKMGTLTYANTVGQLSRAGSSRAGEGGGGPRRPPRRAPPRRAQSCMD